VESGCGCDEGRSGKTRAGCECERLRAFAVERLTSLRSRARDATRQLYKLETQQAAARVACSAKVSRDWR
jgi:hypothetical protein